MGIGKGMRWQREGVPGSGGGLKGWWLEQDRLDDASTVHGCIYSVRDR